MIKRNDPCLCGSGKKYKKCCMQKAESKAIVSQELHQLETEMLYTAFTRYQKELTNWVQSYHHVYPDVEESVTETLSSMLLVWLIFHKPIEADGQTIYDTFLESKLRKIKRPQTATIIESWKGTKPAVLEVVSVNEDQCESLHLFTNERLTHIIPDEHKDTVEPGSTIIGFPANGEHAMSFVGPVISHVPAKTTDIKNKIDAFRSASEGDSFTSKWPQLLSSLLAENTPVVKVADDFEWSSEQVKETADILLSGLKKDQHPPEIEQLALEKWHAFTSAKKVNIRKPEAFAAAMEYALQEFAPLSVTQKALAEKYNVSASTISSRSIEITNELRLAE
ncbi:SEC-C domain-containing protein [Shouchella sp. JSM 1781072]|uniref:SEC-C domain-containing protein n=1 Tax=Shouchella sp. JSM 1781072 TaxID=3344581 RepID=UPI0035C0385C